MKLYAQGNRWKLYSGDSLFTLRDLAEDGLRVDGVVTDPPYSSGGQFRGDRMLAPATKYLDGDSKQAAYLPTFAGDNRDQRAFTIWLSEILARCLPMTKPGSPVCVFTDWRQTPATVDALQIAGFIYRGLQPWIKPPGSARPRMGWFWNPGEFVVVGTAGALSSDRPGIGCLAGHIVASAPRDREHVTEKPSEVCDWLVSVISPGGTILDPFCGSGAIGEAALRSGRSVVCMEAEAEYLRLAARRLEQAEDSGVQGTMFGPSTTDPG